MMTRISVEKTEDIMDYYEGERIPYFGIESLQKDNIGELVHKTKKYLKEPIGRKNMSGVILCSYTIGSHPQLVLKGLLDRNFIIHSYDGVYVPMDDELRWNGLTVESIPDISEAELDYPWFTAFEEKLYELEDEFGTFRLLQKRDIQKTNDILRMRMKQETVSIKVWDRLLAVLSMIDK